MLDAKHAQALVAELQQADAGDRISDPTLPMRLIQARHEVEASIGPLDHDEHWFHDVSSAGLVGAGLRALARWHALFQQ